MALLETCLCCSLLVASAIVGIYALVAYIVAFTIELWWILEAEVTLPTPAYILCAGYFFIFILSALLLHGLTVKRTLYLLGWLFMVGMFTFPEAGLVLFMTVHFWHVTSVNGLTELTCWVCRFICNIAGFVCVQSLYSTWKEEKIVSRRLQALNMASILAENGNNLAIHSGNGHPKNGQIQATSYTNAAFVGSTSSLGSIGDATGPKSFRSSSGLHRRMSVSSHYSGNQHHFRLFNNPGIVSEFNAAQFNGMLVAGMLRDVEPSQIKLRRSLSVGDLSNNDPWRVNVQAPQPTTLVDYIPVNATQSLDRRMLRYNTRLRCAGSMDELNNLRYRHNGGGSLCCEGRVYNVLQTPDFCIYRRPKFVNKSVTSLSESDDLQKYRDVAL